MIPLYTNVFCTIVLVSLYIYIHPLSPHFFFTQYTTTVLLHSLCIGCKDEFIGSGMVPCSSPLGSVTTFSSYQIILTCCRHIMIKIQYHYVMGGIKYMMRNPFVLFIANHNIQHAIAMLTAYLDAMHYCCVVRVK